ncbi:MAG: glycosyltransferase [Candidatus Binatia bacterium]
MAATSTTRHPLDLLVVSDIWPPPFIGGYELGAHDIVSRLAARGHRVTVLTSTFGATATAPAPGVHRVLHEHIQWRPLPWPALVADTVRAMRTLPRARRLLDTAVFDLIYLFNPLGLNAAFVQALCDTGRPLVAYVSDDWIAQWPRCDRLWVAWTEARSYLSPARRIGMALARRLLLRRGFLPEEAWRIPIRHAQFVSRHIQKVSTARIAPTTQEVIPWGIAVDRFPYRERRAAELHEWIVCGQVEPHKGIATVVDAVALLRGRGHPVRVTLHGADTTPFARTLKDRVARDGLADAVRFAGAHPRELLAERAYGPAGLLVFASEWEEPFSITLLEAFASGLPVLTTLTGGTGEIARHGDTATVFTAGDSAHLAAQWEALVRRPDRALAMARRAREIVARHLTIDGMVDRVEQHLLGVAEGRGSTGSEPWIPRPHPWEPSDVAADAPSRAVVPDAEDGTWVAALWRDLGRFGVIESAEPEIDAAFPALHPRPPRDGTRGRSGSPRAAGSRSYRRPTRTARSSRASSMQRAARTRPHWPPISSGCRSRTPGSTPPSYSTCWAAAPVPGTPCASSVGSCDPGAPAAVGAVRGPARRRRSVSFHPGRTGGTGGRRGARRRRSRRRRQRAAHARDDALGPRAPPPATAPPRDQRPGAALAPRSRRTHRPRPRAHARRGRLAGRAPARRTGRLNRRPIRGRRGCPPGTATLSPSPAWPVRSAHDDRHDRALHAQPCRADRSRGHARPRRGPERRCRRAGGGQCLDGRDAERRRGLAYEAKGRVRLVHEAVLGLSAARNHGLAESRGAVAAFLDDDATPRPGWLRAAAGPVRRPCRRLRRRPRRAALRDAAAALAHRHAAPDAQRVRRRRRPAPAALLARATSSRMARTSPIAWPPRARAAASRPASASPGHGCSGTKRPTSASGSIARAMRSATRPTRSSTTGCSPNGSRRAVRRAPPHAGESSALFELRNRGLHRAMGRVRWHYGRHLLARPYAPVEPVDAERLATECQRQEALGYLIGLVRALPHLRGLRAEAAS